MKTLWALILATLATAAGATQLDLTGADVRVGEATNPANAVPLSQVQTNWGGQPTPTASLTGMVYNVGGRLFYATNPVTAYTAYWSKSPDGSMAWTDFVPTPAPGTFTNKTSFSFIAGNQTFVVPAGITQVLAKCWGAGASGVSGVLAGRQQGGFSQYLHTVAPGDTWTIRVGGTGYYASVTGTTVAGGWPDGGAGFVQTNAAAAYLGGGSGSTSIWLGTNLLQVAGGAGGSMYDNAVRPGGAGGGITGETGGTVGGDTGVAGGGGTQSAGGRTNGAFMASQATITGGSAPVTTNQASQRFSGGGGGYYGGGAGYTLAATGAADSFERATSGGGSGYIPIANLGTNIRGNNSGDEDWNALETWGRGGADSTVAGGCGSNGGCVVRY